MLTYATIDAWDSKIKGTDCQFRIIQYAGANGYVIERIVSDDFILSENASEIMTRAEVEDYFTNKSVMSIPDSE